VFSGSAIQDGQKHILVYTGVDSQKLENGKTKTLQTQCIAIGDGTDYKKYLQNPVGDIVYAFQRGVVLKISVILKSGRKMTGIIWL